MNFQNSSLYFKSTNIYKNNVRNNGDDKQHYNCVVLANDARESNSRKAISISFANIEEAFVGEKNAYPGGYILPEKVLQRICIKRA